MYSKISTKYKIRAFALLLYTLIQLPKNVDTDGLAARLAGVSTTTIELPTLTTNATPVTTSQTLPVDQSSQPTTANHADTIAPAFPLNPTTIPQNQANIPINPTISTLPPNDPLLIPFDLFITLAPIFDPVAGTKIMLSTNGTHMEIVTFDVSNKTGIGEVFQSNELLTVEQALLKYNIPEAELGDSEHVNVETKFGPPISTINTTPQTTFIPPWALGITSSPAIISAFNEGRTENSAVPQLTSPNGVLIQDGRIITSQIDSDSFAVAVSSVDDPNSPLKLLGNRSLVVVLTMNNDSFMRQQFLGLIQESKHRDPVSTFSSMPQETTSSESQTFSNDLFLPISTNDTFTGVLTSSIITFSNASTDSSTPVTTKNTTAPFVSPGNIIRLVSESTSATAIVQQSKKWTLNFTITDGMSYKPGLSDQNSPEYKEARVTMQKLVEDLYFRVYGKRVFNVSRITFEKGSVIVKMDIDIPDESTITQNELKTGFQQGLVNGTRLGNKFVLGKPQKIDITETVQSNHPNPYPAYKATAIVAGILAFFLLIAVLVVLLLAIQHSNKYSKNPITGLSYKRHQLNVNNLRRSVDPDIPAFGPAGVGLDREHTPLENGGGRNILNYYKTGKYSPNKTQTQQLGPDKSNHNSVHKDANGGPNRREVKSISGLISNGPVVADYGNNNDVKTPVNFADEHRDSSTEYPYHSTTQKLNGAKGGVVPHTSVGSSNNTYENSQSLKDGDSPGEEEERIPRQPEVFQKNKSIDARSKNKNLDDQSLYMNIPGNEGKNTSRSMQSALSATNTSKYSNGPSAIEKSMQSQTSATNEPSRNNFKISK